MSIGLDGAFCADRGSSPVDMSPALRVPSAEVPSAQQHFLKCLATYKTNTQCRVGGMVLRFSAPRKRFVEVSGDYNTGELGSWNVQVIVIKICGSNCLSQTREPLLG